MNVSYANTVEAWLADESNSSTAFSKFSVRLLRTILEAKLELGEPVTPESLHEDLNNVAGLRDRYLDSRWGKKVGHNQILSQLERVSRRYDQEYISKLAATLWPVLAIADKDLGLTSNA
ncbi:hypothetical protein [Vibrio mediterranei]|uniref:hypothetical protein n=1 Tax=Vibrio mediterranei TaxID=689 RepID=UPI004068B321